MNGVPSVTQHPVTVDGSVNPVTVIETRRRDRVKIECRLSGLPMHLALQAMVNFCAEKGVNVSHIPAGWVVREALKTSDSGHSDAEDYVLEVPSGYPHTKACGRIVTVHLAFGVLSIELERRDDEGSNWSGITAGLHYFGSGNRWPALQSAAVVVAA